MKNKHFSLKKWAKLYKLIQDFYNLKCWEWMSDSDIFGVQNPNDQKIGYCCIMGKLGRFKGLAVYLGTEGLESYLNICSGKVEAGSFESLLNQKCIMLSFGSIDELEMEDIEIIESLNISFNRNEFPLLRNYQPGYLDWFLDAYDVDFLTVTLEQVIQTAIKAKECKKFLSSSKNSFFVRVNVNGEWKNDNINPKKNKSKETKPLIDVDLLNSLKDVEINNDVKWDIICVNIPTAIRENNERPYYPYILIISDKDTGVPLGFEIAQYNKIFTKFPSMFINTILENDVIPSNLFIFQKKMKKLLEPIIKKYNINVSLSKDIESVKPIIESIIKIIHSEELEDLDSASK